MPRSILYCIDCNREIPANQTKKRLVRVMYLVPNSNHRSFLCVECNLKDKELKEKNNGKNAQ